MARRQVSDETRKERIRQITFKCKFCGSNKPLSDMRVLTRYSPPLVLCKECEKGQ